MAGVAAPQGDNVATWRKAWGRIDIYVWVLLLPALLMGLGAWERSRNAETLALYASAAEMLPADLAQLRAVTASGPMAMIERVNGSERETMPASLAVAEVERAIPIAERGAMLSRIRGPLAIATILGGLLALVAGAAGMLIAAQAGVTARRSRADLIAGFSRVHRILPFVLGALVVGLAVSIVSAAVFETIGMWFQNRVSGGQLKLFGIGLFLAGLTVYGAFSAIRGLRDIFALNAPEPIGESARVITEAEAPGLWRFVHDLAERQKALVPDAIVIGMDGGFYVTEHPVKLHPSEQTLEGRTLYLPAPYLELFDDEELAGVVGHELAHFVGEDTAYSRHFSPIYMGLERALVAMSEATAKGFAMYPALRLGQHAIERFDLAVKHWGRLREFEADRLSSLASGPRSIGQSLVRASVIAPVVSTILDRAYTDPADGESDLVLEMVCKVRDKGWPDVSSHLDDHASHPTDTHPSTPQRIEALGLQVDALFAAATRPPVGNGGSPANHLFADWLATRKALSADFAATAQTAHVAHLASLKSAVAAVGAEEVKLYENSAPMIWVLGAIGAFLGAGAIAVIVLGASAAPDDLTGVSVLAGVLGVSAIGLLYGAAMLARDRRNPVFTFAPDTVFIRHFAGPLRWLDIGGYNVSASAKLEVVFSIAEGAALPMIVGRSWRAKVKKKNRTVTITCYGIRGTRPPALAELVQRYLDAAYALRTLEEQEQKAVAPGLPRADPVPLEG